MIKRIIKRTKVNLNNIESAKKFVEICNYYQSDINVYSGRYIIDGKSILGILSLNLLNPVEVEIASKNDVEADSFINMMKQFESNE